MKCEKCGSDKLIAKQMITSFRSNIYYYVNTKWVSENPMLKGYNSNPAHVICFDCHNYIKKDMVLTEVHIPKMDHPEITLDLDATLFHTEYYSINDKVPEELKMLYNFKIDNTTYYTRKRPYLDQFIEYCIKSFDTINIFTSASTDYANHLIELLKIPKDKMGYIKTRPYTVCDRSIKEFERLHLKRINNSLIIDDQPLVYDGFNNLIYKIPPFQLMIMNY